MAGGVPCAMMIGTLVKLQLCVISWATCEQLKLPGWLSLELEVVRPGIPVCVV